LVLAATQRLDHHTQFAYVVVSDAVAIYRKGIHVKPNMCGELYKENNTHV